MSFENIFFNALAHPEAQWLPQHMELLISLNANQDDAS
jgi:hypothetical protein